MMTNLLRILNTLRSNINTDNCSYYIPAAWNSCDFKAYKTNAERPGEILVNPHEFMAHSIESFLKPVESGAEIGMNSTQLTGHVMYGMLPRMFTAWYHRNDGKLNPGTFLKVICLIPYLKKMNISMIYLLPIFKHSDKYKKGSLGSPYAIKNIYMLDENLHDELLGEYTEELLDVEFKAFVEACHLSGIKVMVDFVFRTVARDNDLVISHPDWFYWIDAKVKDRFCIPSVENEKEHTALSDKSLVSIYNSKGIKDYLSSFRPSPSTVNPVKWTDLAAKCKKDGGNILDYAEKYFGISTVPGFSDVINDSQPTWSDVTYLRYYFDVHEKARKYISPQQVPYILQDGAKLNLYRGDEKNEELWEYIAGVIPHYQKQYGIDGARIDMGHALPPELNREIVSRTKQQDPGFILWSEEFNVKNSGQAKKDGFHFVTSMIWFLYKDISKPGFNHKLLKTLRMSEVPVTGALETPDTPRSARTYNDRRLLKLLVWLNCFMPNAVPFINNGQELTEIQPMNLGLDNTEEGRFVLEKEDPMYGKLAFFDSYCLHWLSEDREWMTGLLAQAANLRKRFDPLISDSSNFPEQTGTVGRNGLLYLYYHNAGNRENVFLLANRNLKMKKAATPVEMLPRELAEKVSGCRLLCRDVSGGVSSVLGQSGSESGGRPAFIDFADGKLIDPGEKLVLLPGEVVIGQFL